MPKYIFLDNWVLSKFSQNERGQRLAVFLKEEGYTVIITSLLLTELYNAGWKGAPEKDRNVHATQLLGAVPCVIVDPEQVFRAEMDAYPKLLRRLPIELKLRDFPPPNEPPNC